MKRSLRCRLGLHKWPALPTTSEKWMTGNPMFWQLFCERENCEAMDLADNFPVPGVKVRS